MRYNWTSECQNAFESLKEFLTSKLLLARPDYDDTFVITTDASDYAIGAVISNEKTIMRPIAYASRALVRAEVRYHVIEKELLAIVWAVNRFKQYIFNQKFIVYTDHRPIVALWNLKETSPTLTRLRLKLQGLEIDIRNKQERENVVADFLSRLPPNKEVTNSNEQSAAPVLVVTRAQRQREIAKNPINNRNSDNDLTLIDINDNTNSKSAENNISEEIYEEFKEAVATNSISTETLSFASHIDTAET